MIYPSYQQLIDHINVVNKELGEPEVLSRYSLVQAIAKRARTLVDKESPMIESKEGEKELSIAIEEMMQEKIGVRTAEPPVHQKEVPFDEMAIVDLSIDYEEEE